MISSHFRAKGQIFAKKIVFIGQFNEYICRIKPVRILLLQKITYEKNVLTYRAGNNNCAADIM